MAHCDAEYTAYANAVLDEADAAVVTDEKYAELQACLNEHMSGSGGMLMAPIETGLQRMFPTALHGYAYTRLVAGDTKQAILKSILEMRE